MRGARYVDKRGLRRSDAAKQPKQRISVDRKETALESFWFTYTYNRVLV
jgi:hypothetical protein